MGTITTMAQKLEIFDLVQATDATLKEMPGTPSGVGVLVNILPHQAYPYFVQFPRSLNRHCFKAEELELVRKHGDV